MTTSTRSIAVLACVLMLLASTLSAQRPDTAQARLRAAADTADVNGDLRGAITQYQAIVETFASDRAVVAQALLRMAEAYEKLGDPQGQTTYQRLVRDFADQTEAASVARGRLRTTSAPARGTGDRMVWRGRISASGRVSPDGRFITGRNRNNGALMVHDVAANSVRDLTSALPASTLAEHSMFSPDGTQLLYHWTEEATNWRLNFRIAEFPARGPLVPQRVVSGATDLPRGSLRALDWSRDQKWIAAAARTSDLSGQLLLISASDGATRVLKTLGWDQPVNIFFSPDGRFLAYDMLAGTSATQRDVMLLAVDGSREIAAVMHAANDNVLGWSPDGRWLLFASDRTGSWDLWGQPIVNGQPSGAPQLLKSNIGKSFEGRTRSLGLTADGALYLHKVVSSRDIVIAPIDLAAGRLTGQPVPFSQGMVGGGRHPAWSPDGRLLAYPCEDGAGIAVRSVATGEVRVLRTLSYANTLQWAPDGRTLLSVGTDLEGRLGLFQVDAQSGSLTRLAPGTDFARYAFEAQWSPDGGTIYFARNATLIARNVATGTEVDVNPTALRGVGARNIGPLSPNGRWVTARRIDAARGENRLSLIPVSGGDAVEILSFKQSEGIGRTIWIPDGTALIVEKNLGETSDGSALPLQRELWHVPVGGGPIRRLDVDTSVWMTGATAPANDGFSLSPDGRSIAFQVGRGVDEVWAIENFLPDTSR